MTNQSSPIPDKAYFSTGEVASYCGVTPNAVFKWVQEGKIAANRTPGGHIRISRLSLQNFLKGKRSKASLLNRSRIYQYCWEFHSRFGRIQDNCRKCIVYKSRANRCYELVKFADEIGHSKVYCVNSCHECDYYDMVHGELFKILVITESNDMKRTFQNYSNENECSVLFAENEYQCSTIIESYRPDYIIIDCRDINNTNKNSEFYQAFIENISNDLRIPLAHIIIVGKTSLCTTDSNDRISSYVEEPFSVKALLEFVNSPNN